MSGEHERRRIQPPGSRDDIGSAWRGVFQLDGQSPFTENVSEKTSDRRFAGCARNERGISRIDFCECAGERDRIAPRNAGAADAPARGHDLYLRAFFAPPFFEAPFFDDPFAGAAFLGAGFLAAGFPAGLFAGAFFGGAFFAAGFFATGFFATGTFVAGFLAAGACAGLWAALDLAGE
jgi:hypothetical protein